MSTSTGFALGAVAWSPAGSHWSFAEQAGHDAVTAPTYAGRAKDSPSACSANGKEKWAWENRQP